MRSLTILTFLLIIASSPATMTIYVIDVEGGNATLVVAPSGESLLIDTGHLNAAVRDSGRVMEALNDAGIHSVDHLVTTHWHLDHFGGMAELARQVPIREFIDHGPNTQPKPEADSFLLHTYPQLYKTARHLVVKPGDSIPITAVKITVVASAGETLKTSLPRAGADNRYCAEASPPSPDQTENSQSIGLHIAFGQFRAIHLGDLSADKEFDLMCPTNRLGQADLFIVSHHGQARANSSVLVDAIEPRAAIMNNGIRKGAEPAVMKTLYTAPGLENLWQLHFSERSGPEYAAPGVFIANVVEEAEGQHNGKAYWIKVSAGADGSFTVSNPRTKFDKDYGTRK